MEWEKTLKHNKHRREAQRRGQSGPDALREDHDGKIWNIKKYEKGEKKNPIEEKIPLKLQEKIFFD